MTTLRIQRRKMMGLPIPYWVFINEQPVGIMPKEVVNISMPEGKYLVSVRLIFQLLKWKFYLGGSTWVEMKNCAPATTPNEEEKADVCLLITNNERWWNWLFNIDLMLWVAEFFIELPYPWNVVYTVLSDGFFVLWLIRTIIIRKRFFKLIQIDNNEHQL